MTAVTHLVRNSLIDKEAKFSMAGDQLVWEGEGGDGRMALADIVRMRIFGYAGGGQEIYQTTLKTRGGKTLKIRSHHYASLGKFEDRSETYAPFVRALALAIAAANHDAEFVAGNTTLRIMWIAVAILLVLSALVMLIIMFDAGGPDNPIAFAWPVVIILVAGPIAFREIGKGNAKTFDPHDPPPTLIGGA